MVQVEELETKCLNGLTRTIMIGLWQFTDKMEKLGGDSDGIVLGKMTQALVLVSCNM